MYVNAGIQAALHLIGKESSKTDHQELLLKSREAGESKQPVAKLFGNPTQLVRLHKKTTISVSQASGKEHSSAFLSYSRYYCT